MMKATHLPVMVDRVVELLAPALEHQPKLLLDCTLGLGGHSLALLQAVPGLQVIGIDRDPQALALAEERLAPYSGQVEFAHAVFDQLDAVLDGRRPDAILADLGLSSLQIDSAQRGFSYATQAPLDMRMDPSDETSAADLVNTLSEVELARTLLTYGDERNARRIARAIVAQRETAPLRTSAELVAVIDRATPAALRGNGHPAKRTFQALRIAVNHELEALAAALDKALNALAIGGRMAVLSYHSGEDRLVKRAFAAAAAHKVPPGVPQVPDALQATHRLLTKGAEKPASAEVAANPRSASARLRAIERER
jgi:16S rRNA (cytosine1402-N4)-methyltransferase